MSLLQMSVSGAVMILAVVILRTFAINRLPKKSFIVLWGVVLLRLLVPFSFPSPFSAYSVVNSHAADSRGMAAISAILPVAPVDSPTAAIVLPEPTAVTIPPYVIVWGIGLIICALYFAVSYVKCRIEFRESLPMKNEALTRWLAEHKTVRTIEIRQSVHICAPLTYGMFKPVILMPKHINWGNTKEIEYILAHEYVHIKRFDAATKLILTAALCIHWFNPLVWVMYVLSNRDIELSCDEAVVRTFGDNTKSAYAHTLISMEETKSGLTPLCNSFSRNAIEERVTAIMKIRKTSLLAMVAAVCLIVGITVVFATSASGGARPSGGHTLGEYEQQKLHDFQFAGYKDMTVAEYQAKAWALLDTDDYMETIDRISQNNMLFKMAGSHVDATFLFYILQPLTAERWQTRKFGGYAETDYEASDNAMLEYWFHMTILDANTLTVREYEDAQINVANAVRALLKEMSLEEVQTDRTAALQPKIDRIAQMHSSEKLKVFIQFYFRPLSGYGDNLSINKGSTVEGKEPRQYGYGSKKDYDSLLALMKSGYQKMSVTDFNAALLDWANEDFDRSQRIMEDVARDDYQVMLSAEERTFVILTHKLSNEENFRMIQSMKTGKPEEDPWYGGVNLLKDTGDGYSFAFCNLWYQFSYHIADKDKLTIEERDRSVGRMINAVQGFWDESTPDELLKLTAADVVAKMVALANDYSSDLLTIKIDENQVQFESY